MPPSMSRVPDNHPTRKRTGPKRKGSAPEMDYVLEPREIPMPDGSSRWVMAKVYRIPPPQPLDVPEPAPAPRPSFNVSR